MRSFLLWLSLCTPSYLLSATDLHVPADYATIQAAVDAAITGDVIIVAAGSYAEGVTISGKDVTIRGAGVGATVIDGSGFSAALTVSGTSIATIITDLSLVASFDGLSANSPLTLQYCEVTKNTHDGVALEDNSGGIVRDCHIHKNGDDGIDIDHRVDVLIEKNQISNNGYPNESGQDGIEIRLHEDAIASTLSIIIRNNTITNNIEDGIQIIDHSPNATDRIITIERNIICDNTRAGIGLMDGGETEEDYRAADVAELINTLNNTIVGNDHGISGGDNMNSGNNIIVDNTTLGMKDVDGGSSSDYNLFFGNGIDHVNSNLGPNSLSGADPLLQADKSLSAGSPAVDAADPNCVSVNGTRCDIGALERDPTTLAVELLIFEARSEFGKVLLSWTTTSESNNLGFEIQCSQSANSSLAEVRDGGCSSKGWSRQGWMAGAGTSRLQQSYSFEIGGLEPDNYFFRLKQIDFDGAHSYSAVIESLAIPEYQLLEVQVFPNPISSASTLGLEITANTDVRITFHDVMGRIVSEILEMRVAGRKRVEVNAESMNLSAGTYWVEVRSNLSSQGTSLVVIN